MALNPKDEIHALQIQAGILGRNTGHSFEDKIASEINSLTYPYHLYSLENNNVFLGDPALLLLSYIGEKEQIKTINSAKAISTGALATSESGKKWLLINDINVSRSKSDLVIILNFDDNKTATFGISTKQCNAIRPTNAQLYFTTAIGFSNLLRSNSISVSDLAIDALRQFCGDPGFRPLDEVENSSVRLTDPRRYFWEEINTQGRKEWENIFSFKQDEISRLLFQKAYLNDPFTPDYLLHKTKFSNSWDQTEIAIYSISELVEMSRKYRGFEKRLYSVHKGTHKDPKGVTHEAPRFGIIQMQRGGQTQHPNQLQFNLEASYFYKI